MIAGILLKKWFWGVWDNLLRFLLLNLLWLLLLAGVAGLTYLLGFWGAGGLLLALVLGLPILAFAVLLSSAQLAALADVHAHWSWTCGWLWLRQHRWALCWLPFCLLPLLLCGSIAFYWRWLGQSGGSWLPLLALLPLLWLLLFLLLLSQYALATTVQLGGRWRAAIKQAVLLVLDNPGTTLLSLLFSTALLLVSLIPLVFLLLGPASLLFWQQVLLSILRYKYRYHQQQAQDLKSKSAVKGTKPSVPWGDLLALEYQAIGPRTWRNTLFPWKD